jgi:predicted alpha-1,2-mannosidase
MAQALNKTDDYSYFMKRAMSYKNLFDHDYNLMRGKDSHGNWRTPFKPHLYTEGGDITEGTSWQYTWYVPQDVPGLIQLFGGREKFTEKLDSLFISQADSTSGVDDIAGRIGEYWHGNEPSHHIIFLYDYAGQPWKTQELSHKVNSTQYGNKPNSLCGNDDCGQMSAWYIFNVLGFYPVCPASNSYAISSPSLKKAVVHLSVGKDLVITADNLSAENIYIQSLKVNGKPWNSPFLTYDAIKDGGTLQFVMGKSPNKKWGVVNE